MFTKSDLRTGMWVEYADGQQRMVLLNTEKGDILITDKFIDINNLRMYNNDLTIKIEGKATQELNINKIYNFDKTEILWEREKEKKTSDIVVNVIAKFDEKIIDEIKKQIDDLENRLKSLKIIVSVEKE
jgi:hypothetical protein